MSKTGITGFGAYIPRLRLERAAIATAHKWMAPSLARLGKGERAFLSWDEDTVTMAVEAVRAVKHAGFDGVAEYLAFASTRAPYADMQNASIIARAVGLPDEIETFDTGGGRRAGVSAMISGLKRGAEALVVASDAPIGKPASIQEVTFGAGAAAFSIGTDKILAAYLGSASVNSTLADNFRASEKGYDYTWEGRWVRDEGYGKIAPKAIQAALRKAGLSIDDIQYLAMPSLLKGGVAVTARNLGFKGELIAESPGQSGYAGLAEAQLLFIAALEKAKRGEKILLVGFGQGVDAVIFEATDQLENYKGRSVLTNAIAEKIVTDSYMRLLSFSGQLGLDWGMRSEKVSKTALTEQYRSASQMEAFMAGQCGKCGTTQFPQLEVCVKPGCGADADGFEQLSLADAPAEVFTFTADWLSYHPAPPLYVGFVQFENSARVLMEIVDVGSSGLEQGTPLRMVYRIKEVDQVSGYRRYFWKATPVARSE